MVETGVARGYTSAAALGAMAELGHGRFSASTSRACAATAFPTTRSGSAVPDAVRDRWTLRLGPSRRLLEPLLRELGEIDVFLHDSDHTYGAQLWEYRTAWPFIRPGGLLISDDVQNTAFLEFCDEVGAEPVLIGRVGPWMALADRPRAQALGQTLAPAVPALQVVAAGPRACRRGSRAATARSAADSPRRSRCRSCRRRRFARRCAPGRRRRAATGRPCARRSSRAASPRRRSSRSTRRARPSSPCPGRVPPRAATQLASAARPHVLALVRAPAGARPAEAVAVAVRGADREDVVAEAKAARRARDAALGPDPERKPAALRPVVVRPGPRRPGGR